MCLCEVAPGPPKPQAACTLTAAEGMEVKTALTSEMAAEAQNATLEFILVNHPLDCPVCDKGGECPLQDLTFRYGPGNTRMTFPKRTFEKPIPISPTIALDRERCILCYRCTRFSESVAEDGQLVAINRGSLSMIATFEDEPYRAPFSGNVIELCPVGALTSTQYRFEARPWEIQNVPTVCGHCPVGCNISATTREGKVKRILSRNHPEVDEGWLCDKGRFAFAPPARRRPDRRPAAARRRGRASRRSRGSDGARRGRAAAPRRRRRRSSPRSPAPRPSSRPTGSRSCSAPASARTRPCCRRTFRTGSTRFRAPLSSIRDATAVVVLCDEPVVERAPVVDLWIKAARRNGARDPHRAARTSRSRARAGHRRRRARDLVRARDLGADGRLLPAAHAERPRRRRRLERRGRRRAGRRRAAAARDLRRRGGRRPGRPRARRARADAVIGIGMFEGSFGGLCDLVLPGTSYLERDGTTVNLEGRLQRQRRAVIAPCPDELAWIAKLAERFGVELSPHASLVFDEVSAICYGGISFGEVGEQAPLPAARRARTPPAPKPPSDKSPHGEGLRLLTYRPLFSGPAVERTPELAVPAAERRGRARPRRRARPRDRHRRHGHGQLERHERRAPRPDRRRPRRPARCASPRGDAGGLHALVEVSK